MASAMLRSRLLAIVLALSTSLVFGAQRKEASGTGVAKVVFFSPGFR